MSTIIGLKENEAVWVNDNLVQYKKYKAFKYYRNDELLSKSTFIEFNPYVNDIVAVLKNGSDIDGYTFNGATVSESVKNKIIAGIKKAASGTDIKNIESAFKPIYKNDTEQTYLNIDTLNIVGTVTALDKPYITRIVDRSLNNVLNPDPMIIFSVNKYIESKFSKDLLDIINNTCNLGNIRIKQSVLTELTDIIFNICKPLYDSGRSNDQIFSLTDMVGFAEYLVDSIDPYEYYSTEECEGLVAKYLYRSYVQTHDLNAIIKATLKKYEENI